MDCKDLQELLHRYVDGELAPDLRAEADTHLETCADCRRLVAEETAWQQAIHRAGPYYAAPDEVRRRIARLAGRPAFARPLWRGWAMAAALLLAVALSSGVTAYIVTGSGQEPLTQEIVTSHVRSLMADHLTDVASSDQHTVKPWFHGWLDYAPPVADTSDAGFPLIGGRLDYIDHRPVAALVYRRNQHPINLFVFPSDEADGAIRASVRNGYNIVHWTAHGMTSWAVSDVNAAELLAFAQLLQRQG
ncbi:MAG TPA: anti-sigma factor [Stellaceae bacterium]